MEVYEIVQEAVIKTIPKKKKSKKAKWLSEKALQIAEKRREVKGKGVKENTHMSTESQRIARRDKKGFLGDQCKEIEENNRMGKTSLVAQRLKRESACNAGDLGLIPGLGRSPGEEKDYPLHFSGLENSMYSPWGRKESDTTERLSLLVLGQESMPR